MVKLNVETVGSEKFKVGVDNVKGKVITHSLNDFEIQDAYSDTGLLPCSGDGLLQMRRWGNITQVAYQVAPRKCLIRTQYRGATGFLNKPVPTERGTVSTRVAQPWVLLLFQFVDNNLIGGRMFYSPEPFTHADVPLYHTNLPNTVSYHYNNTSLGWICLYGRNPEKDFTTALKVAIYRALGGEGYNGNMVSIDGAMLYNNWHDVPGMRTILEWEQITKEDPDFVMREENLFPIHVWHPNSQATHASGDGATICRVSGEKMSTNYNGTRGYPANRGNRKKYLESLKGIPLTYGIAVYGTACYLYGYRDMINIMWQKRTGLDQTLPQSPFHSGKIAANVGRGLHNPLQVPTIPSVLGLLSKSSPNLTKTHRNIPVERMPKSFTEFRVALPTGTKCIISGEEIGTKEYIELGNGTYVLDTYKEDVEKCCIDKKFYLLSDLTYSLNYKTFYLESNAINARLQHCDNCKTLLGNPDPENLAQATNCKCYMETSPTASGVIFEEGGTVKIDGVEYTGPKPKAKRAKRPMVYVKDATWGTAATTINTITTTTVGNTPIEITFQNFNDALVNEVPDDIDDF